ncbi:hypothetical protein B0H14DRAFT_2732821, partial [Mycena olivaceomarginata]
MADSLPPAEIQRQIQVSAYVFSGATAVLFWDILNNLGSDYSILFKQKFQWSALVYLGCRYATIDVLFFLRLRAIWGGDRLITILFGFLWLAAGTARSQTRRVQLTALFSGSNLPAFSKSLFTDGQVYYIAVYHSILVIPNVLLTSINGVPALGISPPESGMTGSLGRSEGDLVNPEFTGSKRGASKLIPSFQPRRP